MTAESEAQGSEKQKGEEKPNPAEPETSQRESVNCQSSPPPPRRERHEVAHG
jgi:hypothetical protein